MKYGVSSIKSNKGSKKRKKQKIKKKIIIIMKELYSY